MLAIKCVSTTFFLRLAAFISILVNEAIPSRCDHYKTKMLLVSLVLYIISASLP